MGRFFMSPCYRYRLSRFLPPYFPFLCIYLLGSLPPTLYNNISLFCSYSNLYWPARIATTRAESRHTGSPRIKINLACVHLPQIYRHEANPIQYSPQPTQPSQPGAVGPAQHIHIHTSFPALSLARPTLHNCCNPLSDFVGCLSFQPVRSCDSSGFTRPTSGPPMRRDEHG